jgi:hypothetical protein
VLDEVADALGDLPLALEQAAAYVNAKAIIPAGYLQRLRDRAPEPTERLLAVPGVVLLGVAGAEVVPHAAERWGGRLGNRTTGIRECVRRG